MGELLDQFIIEAKNLGRFVIRTVDDSIAELKIEEVKEPHHSQGYNSPKGHTSQVMKGTQEYSPQKKTRTELLYLKHVQKPIM